MQFWNGNKSPARQRFELEILHAVVDAANYPDSITDDRTDYPSAEDEGCILERGADTLVTVWGNSKFANKDKIVIDQPLAKGLLGKRLLLIRQSDQAEFSSIDTESAMKNKVAGIPATWADADLFRANGYPVAEKGSLEDIFFRLADGEFDYVSLGALEIEDIHRNVAAKAGDLVIQDSLMLAYPMPLVFYVNPTKPELARIVREGLQIIQGNGQFDSIFDRHFGETIGRLSLNQRKIFYLTNPIMQGGQS